MTGRRLPDRPALKLQARQAMRGAMRICLTISLLAILMQNLVQFIQLSTEGSLGYYVLDATRYTETTGIYPIEGGISLIVRLEGYVLLVLPLEYRQLPVFFLIQVVVLLLSVPLAFGALEQFHRILEGHPPSLRGLFRWYLDVRLILRAALLSLALGVVEWGSRLILALPGLLLFLWGASRGDAGLEAMSAGSALMGVGAFVAYFLYTFFLPARYELACHPEYSVRKALGMGLGRFRGQRGSYFLLRLSFLPWVIISNLAYASASLGFLSPVVGLLVYTLINLNLFPYLELTNLAAVRWVADQPPTSFQTAGEG